MLALAVLPVVTLLQRSLCTSSCSTSSLIEDWSPKRGDLVGAKVNRRGQPGGNEYARGSR